jgi:signal transduction histidine kinase
MQTRRIDDARVPKNLARSMATGITALAVFLAVSLGCPAGFAADSKRVMLLHSFGLDFKPWSEYAKSIRTELKQQSPWPLDIVEHSLITARFSDQNPEAPFVEYLRAQYTEHPIDLIVSIGAPAAAFVQRHRQRLFAITPMVFTALDQRRVQYSSLTANDAVVPLRINYLSAFENILRVLPDTKDVIVVVGTSPIEKFWKEAIGKEVEPLANRIKLSWTDELSFEALLKQASALPPHTAIFWELMIVDAAGVVHEGDVPLKRLHAVATAPMFSYDESFFGNAIVGGPLLLAADTGRQTAAVAVRILGGEKAGDIKIPSIEFAAPKFDWRQMQRWGISESRLPPRSEVHFREPTIWQQHFWSMVAISAALALLSCLVLVLIWEDRRRRRSEANAQALTGELAHMNRIATAGQLTASIAHEIRQPLAAISTFGMAGLNWLKREPPNPNLNNARSGLENIVKAVHRVDDVINSVTALFKNESTTRTEVYVNALVEQVLVSTARARNSNGILLETNLVENPPPYVMADPVQLQQVALNLITNAIEAMSASQRGARILRVDTNVDPNNSVIITVADSGPGIDPKIVEQLFKPFFTTKSSGMGLGLPICKSIIEAHQGKLTVASREPHGAVFRIELPRHRQETN